MSTFSIRRCQLAGLALLAALVCLALPAAAHAAPCDAPITNPVACENTKPGTPASTWQIDGWGDESIQGFATSMSVNKGSNISFKIKSATPNYRIDILRLGYYGGNGARLIASNLAPTNTAAQPACQTFSATGLIDCGNWAVSRTWTVPSTAVSGVYVARLVRNDTGGDSHITFVVRDDSSTSDVMVQTSDATWQAYNTYGGNSFYTCSVACPPGNPNGYKGAFKISYNRPFQTSSTASWLMSAEYPMIRFLERMGYNLTYASQTDTETSPALIRNHRLFVSSGHDEYWSKNQRRNVEAARDAGVNLAFFSGNEVFWKTRYENANRTLVNYKDTHFDAPTDPVEFTGTWRDPRFGTDNTPENALTGQSFAVNAGTSHIMVPFQYKNLRLWRNTAVTALSSGQSLRLGTGTLGYEWDEDVDNGYRPAGQFRASSTTVSGVEAFIDYGSFVDPNATATHNLVTYRAASGALVFGAGTVQWAWGLDDENPLEVPADRNMQQATVNLFADMSAQPSNLIPNVVGATKSTDTTRPTSTISSPPATVADGSVVTLTGTAADSGGGVVAGVEITTDNGATWHPVTSGTTNWSYTWRAHGAPTTTIKTRAVDDSGNLQVPGAGVNVNVTCPCSIWGASFPVPNPDAGDSNSVEVGMKFTSDRYGTISGLRFYKSAANTGTHIGSLWTASGTRLALATFTNETASGWQTVTFGQPVEVQPNTTYVASYFAPNGHYAGTFGYFYPNPAPAPQGGGVQDSPPLHAVRDSGTTRNGVYTYATQSTFPNNSFGASNYWVDVLFTPISAPGTVTGVTATSGGTTSANVTWNAPATGGAPTSYLVTPYVGAVAQTARAKTVTGTPPLTSTTVTGLTNGTTYTFRVTASNPTGSGPQSASSNAVTPQNPVVPSAPTGVVARPATTSANVSWNASASNGDSALTGYTVTPFVGSVAQAPVTVGPSTTSTTITGLTNGSAYTFTVKANNGVGSSPASLASSPITPQSTIFDFATPTTIDGNDNNAVELGLKFTADVSGTVTGVRFYKSAANTGTHTGSLWTTTGTRLAQATFTNESASGWQHATFATPVNITAGTTYVVSYYAPVGRYSSSAFEGGGVDNGPLHTVRNSASANGVYSYGPTSQFPTNTFNASNYWVDVMFALPPPGQPTGVTAVAAGQSSATVSWNAPASGGAPTSYLVTAYAGSTAQVTKTVTGSPLPTSTTVTGLTTGTAYTFRVTARNVNGGGPQSAPSNAVTPLTAVVPTAPTNVFATPASSSARVSWDVPSGNGDSPVTSYTVTPFIGAAAQTATTVSASTTATTITGLSNGTAYTFRVKATNAVGDSAQSAATGSVTPAFTLFEFATPVNVDAGDPNSVNVGVKFRPASNGLVRGVRFYKSTANTGTHVGSLWSAAGALLAQATFTNESPSGWQAVTFATPVSVTAGTTYVASYLAPAGHYSVTTDQFGSAGLSNPPLEALGGSANPNGVYAYGASSTFPNNSYNATNYWVDALYTHAPPPGPPTGVTATAGQASATVSWTAPASGGAPTSYSIQPRIGGSPAGSPKTITGTPPATSTTVTGLTAGTAYTFTVTAANAGGSGTASAASNAVTPTGASAPTAPTAVAGQGDSKSAIVRWTAPSSDGGSAITSYTVVPYVGAIAQATTTVPGTATSARVTGLTNHTSYTFRVSASSAAGASPISAPSGAVVPRASIFELGTPATIDGGDPGSVNLGVKFTSDVAGTVTGVRFYKSAANTGTHVGSLWSASGTLLAQGTFANETASGWQALTFASPVAITAGTTYVVSYLAPNGRYSVTSAGFGAGPINNVPLHGVSDSVSENGVYAYGASSVFPVNSFNAGNYWVDLLFAPGS